ncbi:hypothetical protein [Alicyclobacillus dauci]|uniref:Uncharacterized protein n=1 Tax=Alicyclobacillus dauci TaxID=1475485 RepID=A0ABY6Z2Q0_9BACL|nr:hypothetical protein [Alicyclobacillus dauci]WAH36476.1 hypothetical protein NZD86_20035 [Alicyclobacillus dauci]
MPRKLLTDAQLGILQVMSSRQQGGIDPNSGLPMGFYTSMIDLFNPSQPAKSLLYCINILCNHHTRDCLLDCKSVHPM